MQTEHQSNIQSNFLKKSSQKKLSKRDFIKNNLFYDLDLLFIDDNIQDIDDNEVDMEDGLSSNFSLFDSEAEIDDLLSQFSNEIDLNEDMEKLIEVVNDPSLEATAMFQITDETGFYNRFEETNSQELVLISQTKLIASINTYNFERNIIFYEQNNVNNILQEFYEPIYTTSYILPDLDIGNFGIFPKEKNNLVITGSNADLEISTDDNLDNSENFVASFPIYFDAEEVAKQSQSLYVCEVFHSSENIIQYSEFQNNSLFFRKFYKSYSGFLYYDIRACINIITGQVWWNPYFRVFTNNLNEFFVPISNTPDKSQLKMQKAIELSKVLMSKIDIESFYKIPPHNRKSFKEIIIFRAFITHIVDLNIEAQENIVRYVIEQNFMDLKDTLNNIKENIEVRLYGLNYSRILFGILIGSITQQPFNNLWYFILKTIYIRLTETRSLITSSNYLRDLDIAITEDILLNIEPKIIQSPEYNMCVDLIRKNANNIIFEIIESSEKTLGVKIIDILIEITENNIDRIPKQLLEQAILSCSIEDIEYGSTVINQIRHESTNEQIAITMKSISIDQLSKLLKYLLTILSYQDQYITSILPFLEKMVNCEQEHNHLPSAFQT